MKTLHYYLILTITSLIFSSNLHARAVFTTSDPAFNNSITINFPPPELVIGESTLEFTRNGVNFRLEYLGTHHAGLYSCDSSSFPYPPGISMGVQGGQESYLLTLSPPISALGFTGYGFDGVPIPTIVGSAGSEQEVVGGVFGGSFFGAADIGHISTVIIDRIGAFCLSSMTFVPPAILPSGSADLELTSLLPQYSVAAHNTLINIDLDLQNLGSDTANQPFIIDYPPPGLFTGASPGGSFDPNRSILTWNLADLPVGANGLATQPSLDITTPAGRPALDCRTRLLNIASVNSATPDPLLSNNLVINHIAWDRSTMSQEICGNGIDDDCDGMFDCSDSDCLCRPSLPSNNEDSGCQGGLGTGLVIINNQVINNGECQPENNPGNTNQCFLGCGANPVPASCCDSLNATTAAQQQCRHFAGCAVDPNYKEANPPVNADGYGYTSAGQLMTYTVHYENIGTGDAINVNIVDSLDDNLDESTLNVIDNGVSVNYDPETRSLVWSDPILPPNDPRSVSFQIAVRDDAPSGTRIRNDAVIIFPNAAQPRTDTNFVEHVIPDPSLVIAPEFDTLYCAATNEANKYNVNLVNKGFGFAYNVTARIIDAPSGVTVINGNASFSHPDDEDPEILATVVPNAYSRSDNSIELLTRHPEDPCQSLSWQINWTDSNGSAHSQVLEPVAGRLCDANNDASVDRNDIRAIMAFRNQAVTAETAYFDLDENGLINILDARRCTLACDEPRCIPLP